VVRCSFSPFEREVHAPAGDVCHRGLADQLGEACGERRARHRDLVGKRRERPGPCRVAVDQGDRASDLWAWSAPSHPVRAAGSVSIHERIARIQATAATAA
jgi:hypothetical protein